MLSILYTFLWGHATGMYAGVSISAGMMDGKHNYKREDVKSDALKKEQKRVLDEKYPNIETVYSNSQKEINEVVQEFKNAKTFNELEKAHAKLKQLPSRLVNSASLPFILRNPPPGTNILPTDDETTVINKLRVYLDKEVGELKGNAANFYEGSTKNWQGAFGDINIKTTYDNKLKDLDDLAKVSSDAFLKEITDGNDTIGVVGLGATNTYVIAFNIARTAYTADDTNPTKQAALTEAGTKLVSAFGFKQVEPLLPELLANAALQDANGVNSSVANEKKAYDADGKKLFTANDYGPEGSREKPLTSPANSNDKDEADKWENLEGEEINKRDIKLSYGVVAGYQKELNKHMIAGGEIFAQKHTMTIKYDLRVKDRPQSYGTLEHKPQWTVGFTVVAGKHFNPVFSVVGRGSFGFSKQKFTYDASADSPRMANETIQVQTIDKWVKQPAVGVGARYQIGDGYSVEACYDFLPAVKIQVRDFKDIDKADKRRRGYMYTTSQHQLTLRVVKFFNGG